MNSTQPDEPYRQLSLWDYVADSPQNIQRDDLVEAFAEKSALGETRTGKACTSETKRLSSAHPHARCCERGPGRLGPYLDSHCYPAISAVRDEVAILLMSVLVNCSNVSEFGPDLQ